MSPSLSGNLEVERYIGACLISQNHYKSHPKLLQNHNGRFFNLYPENYRIPRCTNPIDGWTNGVPFLYAHYQRKHLAEDLNNPLTRLAVHTQGAPLILSKSYNHRKKKFNQRKNDTKKDTPDTVSVTSDESTSSNNLETSLPRIIKPRKRRKKDRKLPPLNTFALDASSDSTSPEFQTTPPFEHFLLEPPLENEIPKLHHTFDEIEDVKDINGNQTTTCQCKYCDPSGQIWDVSRSCYSSFLTPPDQNIFTYPELNTILDEVCLQGLAAMSLKEEESNVSSYPCSSSSSSSSIASSVRDLEVSTSIVTSLNGHRDLEIKFFSAASDNVKSSSNVRSDVRGNSEVCASADSSLRRDSGVNRGTVRQDANLDDVGEESELMRPLIVDAPTPPPRPWIPLARPTTNRQTCIFTVMCYNVLCDKYATRQMYSYCPSWALNWDYRKKGILEEIRHYAADIINLQEVEMEQFYNYFLPELKQDGYSGIYSPKSRAKHMAESERKYVDGCAIFYRSSKFTLIKEHLVEFNQLAMANADGLDHMLNRVMPKDNIGLAALLQTTEAAWENTPADSQFIQQPLLVCTAHIHWDPEFCDVKLIQTMMLSNELKTILEDSAQTLKSLDNVNYDSSNIQLVLCGDFNSLPDSGVIEFLGTGRVSQDHKDFKDFSYKSCLEKVLACDKPNEFTHSFKLSSAYNDEIMPFTNYTFDFKGIIDYIFFSKQTMTPLGLLGPISQEWLTQNKVIGCPHPHVFSDHFPLLVELEMVPTVNPPMNGIIGHR